MDRKPTTLITGAGRGIGRAIAIALSREGYRPVISARGFEGLEETARLCIGGDAVIIPADLLAPETPESLVEKTLAETGRLDLLVNNAGTAIARPFEETDRKCWDDMMNLNARAPFLLTRAALPSLRRAPAAVVVNIGSVVSYKGYELQAAYTASKHALAGWTKVLAREVYSEGIRVHLIAPGGVATDLVGGMRPDIDVSGLIAPEEIADAVVFLVRNRGNAVIDVLDLHRAGKAPFS